MATPLDMTDDVARPAASGTSDLPIVVRAVALGKLYPRARAASGFTGWFLSRLRSAEGGVPDEDDDLDDEDEEFEEREEYGGEWVIRDVDLELRAGTSTGIVGPTGSGKTSLIRLLSGLIPPTEGRIQISGRVVPVLDALPKLMQDNDVKRNVVLLARVLGLPRSWAMRRRSEIITFAGLEGSERRLRKQLTSEELHRLGVATMLHVDGSAYLVDSTLGGRDRSFREQCLRKLADHQEAGAAVVHAGRELEGIERLCDNVLWLESGKIVAQGTAAAVGEEIARQRSRARVSDAPRHTTKVTRLVGFLAVAIGDLRANDALHAAEEAARATGAHEVDWLDVATHAGYDVSEAQRIVDRLSRAPAELFPNAPASAAPPRLLAARAAHYDLEQMRVVARVEGAAGSEFTCSVGLRSETGAVTRLDQPEPYRIEQQGVYEVEVLLPPGAVSAGSYEGIFELVHDGVVGSAQPFELAIGPTDPESDPPTELEWHVRRARD